MAVSTTLEMLNDIHLDEQQTLAIGSHCALAKTYGRKICLFGSVHIRGLGVDSLRVAFDHIGMDW